MQTIVVINISKGLWGKSIIQDLAIKKAQVKNENEIIIMHIESLKPDAVLIDDMCHVSYVADKFPKVETYTGRWIDGELWREV